MPGMNGKVNPPYFDVENFGQPSNVGLDDGSQFTIIEDVPEDRLAIRIRKPPELDKEAILKTLKFDDSWVQIIK